MADKPLTAPQLQQYYEDGYLLVRQLFDSEEIGMLGRVAREDRILDENAADRQDGEGGSVRLSLWNHPGDEIYGMFARCERVTNTAEQILNDEAYHYHSKMIMKDAKVGGAWTWHQDYGYWSVFLSQSMQPQKRTAACRSSSDRIIVVESITL